MSPIALICSLLLLLQEVAKVSAVCDPNADPCPFSHDGWCNTDSFSEYCPPDTSDCLDCDEFKAYSDSCSTCIEHGGVYCRGFAGMGHCNDPAIAALMQPGQCAGWYGGTEYFSDCDDLPPAFSCANGDYENDPCVFQQNGYCNADAQCGPNSDCVDCDPYQAFATDCSTCVANGGMYCEGWFEIKNCNDPAIAAAIPDACTDTYFIGLAGTPYTTDCTSFPTPPTPPSPPTPSPVPPTLPPTALPSAGPSTPPTTSPSTTAPTMHPSTGPSTSPTESPSTTEPTTYPSTGPSMTPTVSPSITAPTMFPSTDSPTMYPSTTTAPSLEPLSMTKSDIPSTSIAPTIPNPSVSPSASPSTTPSDFPTALPSAYPTETPHPSASPSNKPSDSPATTPSLRPSANPSGSIMPSANPTTSLDYDECEGSIFLIPWWCWFLFLVPQE